MAARVISQDAVVTFIFSDAAAGTAAPTYGGSALTLISNGLASELSVDEKLDTVAVHGIGDTRKKLRAKRGTTNCSISKFILTTGAIGMLTGGSKIGYMGKLSVKEQTSLTAVVYEGLVTECSWRAGDDAQMETLTLECDVEHA